MTPDWLALPGEESLPIKEQPAEKNSEPLFPIALQEGVDLKGAFAVPVVSETAMVVAKQRVAERNAFASAWRALTPRQKIYLRALQQTGFSHARALKVLREAVSLEPSIRGVKPSVQRQTPSRWGRTSEDYKIVLAAMKAEAAVQVISRDDLLLRAHRAAEYAEEEQPILYQGANTGFTERKPDVMLRANEQLMKATKVLGGDESRGPVGGSGPTLLIQVIQKEGGTVDVTPRGVTIDLPAPDGA